MSISYSAADATTTRDLDPRFLRGFVTVNGAFALASVLWWAGLAGLLAEPLKWATVQGLPPNPGLFEYPFCLCWMLPGSGICCAWVANKAGRRRAALGIALFPIVFLGLIVGWFWLVPSQWH